MRGSIPGWLRASAALTFVAVVALQTAGDAGADPQAEATVVITVEAAFRQFELTGDRIFLIAAARYLAAHAPTVRAQNQTFHIARRLQRGEKLYEDDEA